MMVEKIEFTVAFGPRKEDKHPGTMYYSPMNWMEGYEIKVGQFKGHLKPTRVWGWLYDGDDLEIDEIQYLLELIINANKLNENPLHYHQHIIIPHHIRRFILSAEERIKVVDNLWQGETFFNRNGSLKAF